MSGILLRTALRKSLSQIRYISPIAPRRADRLVSEVYRQLEREFGMLAPPVALNAPAPEVLAACWLMLRESLVVTDKVDRDTKEAVATSVSYSNSCPYCVDVHSMTLEALGQTQPDDSAADHRVRRIAEWARATATADGCTTGETPFPAEHAPELTGVVVAFHFINRMVNIFLPETPLPTSVPQASRGQVLRLLGRFMRSAVGRPHEPGTSLELLPSAPLPADLEWALGSPHIADAFARAAAAIESGADRSVPESVRALLRRSLATWDGYPPGISRGWVTEAVADLPAADQPLGKLAILTALAAFQVDESLINEVRAAGLDDRALIELTAWASLSAARHIGARVSTDQSTADIRPDNESSTSEGKQPT